MFILTRITTLLVKVTQKKKEKKLKTKETKYKIITEFSERRIEEKNSNIKLMLINLNILK